MSSREVSETSFVKDQPPEEETMTSPPTISEEPMTEQLENYCSMSSSDSMSSSPLLDAKDEVHPEYQSHDVKIRESSISEQAQGTGVYETIKLPRDILTSYLLLRLSGKWYRLSYRTRGCLLFALYFSYFIQFAVFVSLSSVVNVDLTTAFKAEELWFNFIALTVLFLFLFKGLFQYSSGLWRWVGHVEKEKNFSYFSPIKGALMNMRSIHREKSTGHRSFSEMIDGTKFYEFRLYLIAVYILYIGFGVYSIVEIGNVSDDLLPKINIGLNVFFVLNIDDWLAVLFAIETGILVDSQFDVKIALKHDTERTKLAKAQQKVLNVTIAVGLTIVAVWVLGNYRFILSKE